MSGETAALVAEARRAQAAWQERPVAERLRVVRRVRALLAREGAALAVAAGAARGRSEAEKLTSEVIPLAEAARFLERRAERLLRPRRLRRRDRPVWLSGVTGEIRREPFGVVLIVGPANYPLFLPGVQALQALVAGNAVLWKPGRQGGAVARLFISLLQEAGVPAALIPSLPETVEPVAEALAAGVDLVVFTGSTEAGREVLKLAAVQAVPVIAELSGEDPVLVREDADPSLVAAALRFGTELNGGDSCIAPRRVYAPPACVEPLRQAALALALTSCSGDEDLLARAGASPYALGAAVFGRDEAAAWRLATRVNAGVVVVNDCVVPTAHPALPFGGRGASGYGVTRGAEGLLTLTRPKTILAQRGRRFHLEPPHPADAAFFLAYLRTAHGTGWRERARQGLQWLRLARAQFQTP